MILPTDRFLHKRFPKALVTPNDRNKLIIILHLDLLDRPGFIDSDTQITLDLISDLLIDLWTSISVDFDPSRRRHADRVEDAEDYTAIPENLLEG
jgi:hypothetical protein